MTQKIKQYSSITCLTALETVRQPIFLLLAVTCVLFTALTPQLLMFQFGEEGKLARDSGLAYHFVFGLFIAGYAACSSLAREIKSGTASAVLSKPVGRGTFLMAKFTGIAAAIAAFSVCAMITTLLSERVVMKFYESGELQGYLSDKLIGSLLIAAPFIALLAAAGVNYWKKRPFGSAAFGFLFVTLAFVFVTAGFFDIRGQFKPFDCRVMWRIVPASLLVTLALVMLSAVAVALSTRLSTVPTMVICTAVFAAGLMSDHLFGRYAGISAVASFFYWILPNWQNFWVADALDGGGSVSVSYIIHAALYMLTWSAGILCLGVLSFRHAEIK